ncbi:Hypothetical protein PHPALM_7961 [Phytophthora palmivora]|uniref:Uncharacterized protein n=1 Tax=Phytophthora palmivora TaxID=4796 RepID=A0A2P4YB05_9STRA|nr:Hypothetical protein PHPALM_7961 [Phytophthora palmivora]
MGLEPVTDGYILVAHSQGGAISRAVIEDTDDHQVRRYISMAGIQNGIFTGAYEADASAAAVPEEIFNYTAYPPEAFYGKLQHDFAVFNLENPSTQYERSQFNLARSPQFGSWCQLSADRSRTTHASHVGKTTNPRPWTHEASLGSMMSNYQQQDAVNKSTVSDQVHQISTSWATSNIFFPVLNNVKPCLPSDDQCVYYQHRRKANFLKLEQAHFFASPEDGVILPWQSSLFGRYSEVGKLAEIETSFQNLTIVNMTETLEYTSDSFGLRTLETRGGLHLHEISGIPHGCWIEDVGDCSWEVLYDQYIYPTLQ